MLAFGGGLTATLHGGNIDSNYANSVLAVLANSSLILDSLLIYRNLANVGTVFGYNATQLAVDNTIMESNGAGEGACLLVKNSQVDARRSVFAKNGVGTSGGALAAYSSALNISNCTFHSNRATAQRASLTDPSAWGSGWGGACLFGRNSTVLITSSHFNNNTGLEGGALCVNPGTWVTIQDSDFVDNGASVGGALAAYAYAHVNISHSRFVNNTARSDKVVNWVDDDWFLHGVGGAIHYSRAQLFVEHSDFTRNKAVMDGGK